MADLHSEFIEAPLWQKISLAALVIFLVGYFFINLFFKNYWKDYKQVRKEYSTLQQKIRAADLLSKDLPILQANARKLLPSLRITLNSKESCSSLLSKLAKQYSLTITSLKPIKEISAYFWIQQPCELQASGRFSDQQKFIAELMSGKYSFFIESLNIRQNGAKISTLSLRGSQYLLAKQFKGTTPPSILGTDLPRLLGFWSQGDTLKVFLNNSLVAPGALYGHYRLTSISRATNSAILIDINTNRKYTLKVLK